MAAPLNDNQITAKGDSDFGNNAGHIPCFYNNQKLIL